MVAIGQLYEVGSAYFQVGSMLLLYYGCVIIYATYDGWPLMVSEEDEDRWYTWVATLNHRFIRRTVGTTGLVALNYVVGVVQIILAAIIWRTVPWHSSLMRDLPYR